MAQLHEVVVKLIVTSCFGPSSFVAHVVDLTSIPHFVVVLKEAAYGFAEGVADAAAEVSLIIISPVLGSVAIALTEVVKLSHDVVIGNV